MIQPIGLNPQISPQANQAIVAGLAVAAQDRPQSMQEWLVALGIKVKSSLKPSAKVAWENLTLEEKLKVIGTILAIGTLIVGGMAATGTLLSGLANYFKPTPAPSTTPAPTKT